MTLEKPFQYILHMWPSPHSQGHCSHLKSHFGTFEMNHILSRLGCFNLSFDIYNGQPKLYYMSHNNITLTLYEVTRGQNIFHWKCIMSDQNWFYSRLTMSDRLTILLKKIREIMHGDSIWYLTIKRIYAVISNNSQCIKNGNSGNLKATTIATVLKR